MKIADKLHKVSDTYTITAYDNGYMFEVGGRDINNDWRSVKIVVQTKEELITLLSEAVGMLRED